MKCLFLQVRTFRYSASIFNKCRIIMFKFHEFWVYWVHLGWFVSGLWQGCQKISASLWLDCATWGTCMSSDTMLEIETWMARWRLMAWLPKISASLSLNLLWFLGRWISAAHFLSADASLPGRALWATATLGIGFELGFVESEMGSVGWGQLASWVENPWKSMLVVDVELKSVRQVGRWSL